MTWIFSLYVAVLFFILTPANLVRLPPKAGKFTVAAFHAVVFALVLHFTGKIVWNFSRSLEGFQEGATPPPGAFTTQDQAYAAAYCNATLAKKGLGGVWDNNKGCTLPDKSVSSKKWTYNKAKEAKFVNGKTPTPTDTFPTCTTSTCA
jgi:hypothetical protein